MHLHPRRNGCRRYGQRHAAGTKETLPEETDALLTHHGIRHVVSVSGLHLVLILSIWGFLCRKLHFHRWLTFDNSSLDSTVCADG
ncbi:MAG: ComEC/Rec2 family competence protein [Ruminococcus callidus]